MSSTTHRGDVAVTWASDGLSLRGDWDEVADLCQALGAPVPEEEPSRLAFASLTRRPDPAVLRAALDRLVVRPCWLLLVDGAPIREGDGYR